MVGFFFRFVEVEFIGDGKSGGVDWWNACDWDCCGRVWVEVFLRLGR